MENYAQELRRESRDSMQHFYWYWTTLSGGTLALLLNFIKDINPINDFAIKILLTYGIIFILAALVFSPVRNFLHAYIVSKTAAFQNISKEEAKHFPKIHMWLMVAVRILMLLSILLYIFGLVLVARAVFELFLK